MVTSFGSLLKQIWNGHHSAVYPTDIKVSNIFVYNSCT